MRNVLLAVLVVAGVVTCSYMTRAEHYSWVDKQGVEWTYTRGTHTICPSNGPCVRISEAREEAIITLMDR